jgi:hypothetical protein
MNKITCYNVAFLTKAFASHTSSPPVCRTSHVIYLRLPGGRLLHSNPEDELCHCKNKKSRSRLLRCYAVSLNRSVFEIPGTSNPKTRRNVPERLNVQQRHHRENLKSLKEVTVTCFEVLLTVCIYGFLVIVTSNSHCCPNEN